MLREVHGRCLRRVLVSLSFGAIRMTPHQKRTLSPLAQRMAGDMRVRNLAQRTIDAYT